MGILKSITLPSPAKINLFLKIVGRRRDGYHELQTVFQLLSLSDTLHFRCKTETSEITLNCQDLDIPAADNLVYKAATLLQRESAVAQGVHVDIEKVIPDGGGLGGGSSNAATTLCGLNLLWNCGYSVPELMALGRILGADVPVFIAGHTAWGEGIGELLTDIELPEQRYLILNPGCHVSTQKIFTHEDLTRDSSPSTIARFLGQGPPFSGLGNDCEPLVRRLFPEVSEALGWLSQWGTAKMTGTGSCIFLAIPTQETGQEILLQVPAKWQAFVTSGTNRSVMLRALSG